MKLLTRILVVFSVLLLSRFMIFPGAMDLTVDLLWAAACCVAWVSTPRVVLTNVFLAELIVCLLIGPRADRDVYGAQAWIIELVALTGMLVSVAVILHLKRKPPIRLGIGLMLLAILIAVSAFAYRCGDNRPFLGIYLAGTCIILLLTATHARRSPIVWPILAGWSAGYFPFSIMVWIADLDHNATGSLCLYAQRYFLIPVSIHLLGILVGVAIIRHLQRFQAEGTIQDQ